MTVQTSYWSKPKKLLTLEKFSFRDFSSSKLA